MANRVGVVLAGGAGRRMGRTKGELVHDGVALAARAAGVLGDHCDRVLISLAFGAPNPVPELVAVFDASPERRGPLAGIDAAFRASGDADLLLLACDYPLASSALLGALVVAGSSGADVTFPSDPSGSDHPLVALWRRTAAAAVASALAGGRLRVRSLLHELRLERLEPAVLPSFDLARELINWNEPGDLEGSG